MQKQEITKQDVPVIAVHTTYGRLKFRDVTEDEALNQYAEAMGWTLEKLNALNPTIKKEKVVRPCLKKSELKSSPSSSTRPSRSQSTPNPKES